jgi:hypothetical protein
MPNYTFSRPFETFSNLMVYGSPENYSPTKYSVDIFNKLDRLAYVNLVDEKGDVVKTYDLFPYLTTTIPFNEEKLFLNDLEKSVQIPVREYPGKICLTDNESMVDTGSKIYRYVANKIIMSSNVIFIGDDIMFAPNDNAEKDPTIFAPLLFVLLVLVVITILLSCVAWIYFDNVLGKLNN